MSYKIRDSRFAFEGRGGLVKFTDGTTRGVLDWEMLVGGPATIAIHGENCRWTDPVARKMTRDEVRQLAREFAAAVPTQIDLAFSDGSEDVLPPDQPP